MKVSILGTGVYGIALASILYKNNKVTMWTRFEEEKSNLVKNRYNSNMSDIKIDNSIEINCDLNKVIKESDLIIIAIPSNFIPDLLKDLKNIANDKNILIASKGLDPINNDFLSNTIRNLNISNNIAFISGPTFAHEMALKYPIGLTIASLNNDTINTIKECFKNDFLKLETTNDIIGVQLCGTIKNVLAISSGIIAGLNYPISTQALLMTNLISYVSKLIEHLNGDPNSIFLLSGIGDIWLTCSSTQSRNYSFGKLIGEGKSDVEINEYKKNNTIEGLGNIDIIQNIMNKHNINSNIINLIKEIIEKKKSPDDLVSSLLNEK